MKKWIEGADKRKIAGVIIILALLLFALGAWGVSTIMAKPQDNVAKEDTIDSKDSGKEKTDKKDEKGSSTKKNVEDSSLKDEKKEDDEKDSEENVPEAGTEERKPTEVVENANMASQMPAGNTSSPSNPTKNVMPQGANDSNQTSAPTQTQTTTPKQDTKPQSQAPAAPVQNMTPAEQPKQEEKPAEQPKQEEKQPVWHDPVYESRWIVDQVAWDETVSTPVYETRTVWYCSTCNANISADPEGHLDETRHGGYWSTGEQIQVGTNTSTIHHEEVGHWEEVMVKDGYWE